MSTIYYVDSENVGDSWVKLLDDPQGRFVVFYTTKSPRMSYPQLAKLMQAENKPELIECHEGNQGLDFQLVSYLGYELSTDHLSERVIVSNDTGFDVVVLFWQEKGVNIKRLAPNHILIPQPLLTNTTAEIKAIEAKKEIEEENIEEIKKADIYKIVGCLGKKSPNDINMVLTRLYGIKNGSAIYQVLKKHHFKTPQEPIKEEERLKEFIDLILEINNKRNLSIPSDLTAFIMENIVDNRNEMAKKLQRKYGTRGHKFQSILKPFYKQIYKLKTNS